MVGWMRESIAGPGVCMGVDRVCVAYAMSSAGVPPTTQYVACWGQLLGLHVGVSFYFSEGWRAGISSARTCAWGLRSLGGPKSERCFQHRVMLAEGINQLDDAPYPAAVDAHLAGRRGQERRLPDVIRLGSRRETKRMAGISRTCDWPTRR